MILLKRKKSKAGDNMEETVITLEEIQSFYDKYGITKDQQDNQVTLPTAFDDTPLVFACSTDYSIKQKN